MLNTCGKQVYEIMRKIKVYAAGFVLTAFTIVAIYFLGAVMNNVLIDTMKFGFWPIVKTTFGHYNYDSYSHISPDTSATYVMAGIFLLCILIGWSIETLCKL